MPRPGKEDEGHGKHRAGSKQPQILEFFCHGVSLATEAYKNVQLGADLAGATHTRRPITRPKPASSRVSHADACEIRFKPVQNALLHIQLMAYHPIARRSADVVLERHHFDRLPAVGQLRHCNWRAAR